jgi:hypothetical protein
MVSRVAPSAICRGNVVAPPRSIPFGVKKPPRARKPAPVSISALTSNGSELARCNAFTFAAMSRGDPTETMMPPTRSSRTSARNRPHSTLPSAT